MKKCASLLSAILLTAFCSAKQKEQPNIVFIMADDFGVGWADLDGSREEINTPNLERLAQSGMNFTKAYAASPVCSPTRAACITGMSPAQIGLTTHIPGRAGHQRKAPVGGPRDAVSRMELPLRLPSYARELKHIGYKTGFIGKWHLAGEGSTRSEDGVINAEYHPDQFGFETNIGGCAYGQPRSWFDPYQNATISDRKEGEYLTDRLGDEAVSFIKKNAGKPFHLSLWPYQVHTPFSAPEGLVEKNNGDRYLAMIESLDQCVGKVLDALEETGTLQKTMVVFYSDNGGYFPSEGLSDYKGSLLEGGVRVPLIVSWPGVVKPGSVCDEPVTSVDFFPTFVHAGGGYTDTIEVLEGKDLRPLLEQKGEFKRKALFWHYPHNREGVECAMGSTVLMGKWKLYQGYSVKEDALYNLEEDPKERVNLIGKFPDVEHEIRGELGRWLVRAGAKFPPKMK